MALDVVVAELEALLEDEERPAHRELRVLRSAQPAGPAELVEQAPRELVLARDERVEEVGPLVRRPGRPGVGERGERRRVAARDAVDGRVRGRRQRFRVRLRRRRLREALAVEPPRRVEHEERRRVELGEVGEHGRRVDAGERVVAEVLAEPRVQRRVARVVALELHQGLQRRLDDAVAHLAQQCIALLVGHVVVGVVRVHVEVDGHAQAAKEAAAVLRDEHLVLQQPPAHERLEVRDGRAVDQSRDAPLRVHREALVEVELRPGPVRDQIAEPAVRDLVRHRVRERPVADDERRRQEGQARVLHAAVGEGEGHHQQIVAAPAVLAEELLAGLQVLLRDARELRGRGVDEGRVGVDGAPRADVALRQIADGQGHEVRGHGRPHLELPEDARPLRQLRRGDDDEGLRRADLRRPGDAHLGRVLAGEEGPVEAGLAHRKNEGLPAGLLRVEPRRRGLAARPVGDVDVAGDEALGEEDDEPRPEVAVARALELGPRAVDDDAVDGHGLVRVEDELVGGALGQALDAQRAVAVEGAGLHVHLELQQHVRDAVLVAVGAARRVDDVLERHVRQRVGTRLRVRREVRHCCRQHAREERRILERGLVDVFERLHFADGGAQISEFVSFAAPIVRWSP